MISFKLYLDEVTSFKSFVNHDYETEGFKHDHKVGRHRISHSFVRSPVNDEHYSYHYEVSGSLAPDQANVKKASHKTTIARSAMRSLNDFVGQKKPEQLTFSAFTPSHDKHFHAAAEYVAKKHGYEHKVVKNPMNPALGPNHILRKKD